MKILIPTISWLVFTFIAVNAQDRHIIVFGESNVKELADQAHISFTVEEFGSSLRQAVEKCQNKVAAISKELFAGGLKEDKLRTSIFHCGVNYGKKAFLSKK